MKLVNFIFIAVLALSASLASAQTKLKGGAEKSKIAIMPTDAVKLVQTYGHQSSTTWDKNSVAHETAAAPLFAEEGQITAFAAAATQKVVDAFVKLNRLTVLDRTAMEKIMKEQNFQMTDNADQNAQVQAGKLLGAQFIVSSQIQGVSTNQVKDPQKGTLMGFGASIDMTVNIIDVTTGEVLFQKSLNANTDMGGGVGKVLGFLSKLGGNAGAATVQESTPTRAAMKALDYCGDKILDWLRSCYPVEGIIFSIDRQDKKRGATEVTITCGKNLGVKKGEEFNVMEEQEVEVEGRTIKKTKSIGRLVVMKLEEDGEFSTCDAVEGGRDILDKFNNKVRLKIVSKQKN
jgi:curli biogenesis system outer membrane secretion channel CsgG